MRDLAGEAAEYARQRVQALRRAVVAEVRDINRGIAHVLRGGILLSVGAFLAGLAVAAIEGSDVPTRALEPGELLDPLLHLRPQALLSLGILVLLLTPVVRVGLSFVAFLRGRDRAYVAIAAVVLLDLSVALLLGIV